MKSKLNKSEFYICLAVWIATNVFTLYKLYESQTELLEENSDLIPDLTDLQPGWNCLSRLKDTSDVEWLSWKFFIRMSGPYLIVQSIITEIIRRAKLWPLKYWYITSSIIFVTLHMGYKQIILIMMQPVLYSVILIMGGKQLSVWLVSITLLVTYNSVKYKTLFWQLLDRGDLYDEEVYLILFCIPWTELRCISYSLDYLEECKKKHNNPSKIEIIVDMLSYCLYLPVLFTGPIILYEEFKKSFDTPNQELSIRLKIFIKDMCIFLFYTFMMELALHYFYFYAMQKDMMLLRMLPSFALCGAGLWMGYQFHLKYVVSYGTTNAFAKLDNVNTPPTPRCIGRIHVYSQMWRYFDVGLYNFLVKYIYKPIMAAISPWSVIPQTLKKIFASFATFAFIFIWHGTIMRIFVWSILNFTGIILEYVSKAVSETSKYKWFKKNVLRSDTMETRFIAFLCTPLLTLSAVSNFYLFAGTQVGDLFFFFLLHPSFLNSIFHSVALYCCCVVSMALEDVPSRSYVRKANYLGD